MYPCRDPAFLWPCGVFCTKVLQYVGARHNHRARHSGHQGNHRQSAAWILDIPLDDWIGLFNPLQRHPGTCAAAFTEKPHPR